jgi:Ca-activated chloride channel family protein
VAALLITWQGMAGAQSRTYRSGVELVNVNVSVVGADFQHVEGLTADHFEVFEDGVSQRVQYFASGELPLDVGILLDTSGSMAQKIQQVQQAAKRFVASLRAIDRGSVMAISSGLRVLQPFTSEVALINQAIDSIGSAGHTPLYTSVYSALKELLRLRESGSAEPRRAALLVLSDGMDTSSLLAFDDLLTIVRRQAIPIYVISPRTEWEQLHMWTYGQPASRRDYELRVLASETGGQAFFPGTLADLPNVYDSIADELAHQYSLGYRSSNDTAGGAFRRISVRVLAAGLRWRARAGYVADASPARAPGGGYEH